MSSLHIQKRSTVLLQVCLSLSLFLSVTGQAAADDSFTTTISFYAGFDLTSGMTELDPHGADAHHRHDHHFGQHIENCQSLSGGTHERHTVYGHKIPIIRRSISSV